LRRRGYSPEHGDKIHPGISVFWGDCTQFFYGARILELLLLIWSFLEPEKMNTLILTCRQFHDTFNNLLYQHAVEHCPDIIAAWISEKGQVLTMREFVKAGGDITNNPQPTPLFAAATRG
jgi:hypothetical protein